MSKLTTKFKVLSFSLDTDPQSLPPLVYCPVNDMLFEVGPKRFLLRSAVV